MKPFLLLLPLLSFAADTWQPFAVDQRVAVQLPGQPQEMNLAELTGGRPIHHARMWHVQASDALYSIARSHLEETLTPRDTLGRRNYYSRAFEAVLRSEQGQLLEYAFFPTSAGQGIEVKYKGLTKVTKQRLIRIMRCLVVDSVSYTFSFRSTDKTDSLGLAGAGQRRRFFDSITVEP
ncbi:MAG: hypothetical protein ACRYFX_23925 [Janthinobacterium lividum]